MIQLRIKQEWKVGDLALKLDKAIAHGVDGAAQELASRVRASLTKTAAGTPSAVGSPPSRQTSSLHDGITWHRDGKGARVGVLKSIKYAAIQEFGGVITAKNRRLLAIPVHPKAKARARMRRGPRSFAFLFMVKSKKGNWLLVRRKGKKGIEVYYVLKPSITLPPRPYFFPQTKNLATTAAMQAAFEANAQKVFGVA
jgi:phage gpG-like protein